MNERIGKKATGRASRAIAFPIRILLRAVSVVGRARARPPLSIPRVYYLTMLLLLLLLLSFFLSSSLFLFPLCANHSSTPFMRMPSPHLYVAKLVAWGTRVRQLLVLQSQRQVVPDTETPKISVANAAVLYVQG